MTRADNIREQRRRRTDDYTGMALRLSIPPEVVDNLYNYRWINDDRGRLERLTQQDDWDVVHDADGNMLRRSAGVGSTGQPMTTVLCRKRKDYCEEDERRKQDARNGAFERRLATQDAGRPGGVQSEPEAFYVPTEVSENIAASRVVTRRSNRRQ